MDVTHNVPVEGPVSAEMFREAMASICAPVSVVAALDGQRPHGTTVSAVTSVSAEPPIALVCLDARSDLLPLIASSGRFSVNILSRGQSAIAGAFARKGQDKFDGVPWGLARDLPRIDDVVGWIACSTHRLIEVGDHVLVLGDVVAAEVSKEAPLTYFRRAFGTHAGRRVADARGRFTHAIW
jgi:flavin reductase (DIM6/NTAB) family NADH-FMN oxidoreductase RutF